MRPFLALIERELKALFYSPVAYVVLGAFFLLTGLNFYSVVSAFSRGPAGVTLVEAYFNTIVFWFALLPVFPLLTMRLYAEEFRLGTWELLQTAPVRDWQIVLAKFLGVFCFYLLLWIPTTLYFAVFQWVTREDAAQALGAYGGSFLLILLMGAFFLSLGALCSALTSSQIVAWVTSFAVIVAVFFTGFLGYVVPNISQNLRDIVAYFSTAEHMYEFTRGLIDTRPLVYYLSLTVLLQFLTFLVLQSRRWRR